MKTIVVGNQKGGVGKSTTAHALGCGLARKGKRVLFVDMDPQGNLSYTLRAATGLPSCYDLLIKGSATAVEALQRVDGGMLIASSPFLSGADRSLKRESKLREAIAPLGPKFDFAIIDTPPALGSLTVNAFSASHCLVIPAQADVYSLQAISQLKNTIAAVQAHSNPKFRVSGILLTRYNARSVLSREMSDMIVESAHSLGSSVYSTIIREGVAIREAQAMQRDIFSYAPKSNTAKDYELFVEEFLKREGGR